MKICSLLPSGTEMACFLGLEKNLVGVTYECDYPPSVLKLPKVVTPTVPSEKLSLSDIDKQIQQKAQEHEPLYHIDQKLIQSLQPDILLSQDLCQVCAPVSSLLEPVLEKLPQTTQVLYFNPKTLNEVFENILELAHATGTWESAVQKVGILKTKVLQIENQTKNLLPKKVFFMEWLDPLYCAGHWIGEMIRIAGGEDLLARPGEKSTQVSWERVLEIDPEYLVISPCGYHLEDTIRLGKDALPSFPEIKGLTAYKKGQIYALDGSSFFVCPGPRLVQGLEILASIFHPEIFRTAPPDSACRPFSF